MRNKWKLKIGLEVHTRIAANSKLFSRASTKISSKFNSNLTFFDAALPGTLPVVNKFCLFQAARAGIALNATVNKKSIFERKHYFYPDSPLGYQITQQRAPIVSNGFVEVDVDHFSRYFAAKKSKHDRKSFVVEIERIQLENDTGKSFYEDDHRVVDLNRVGVGLLEIVTRPSMNSSVEACAFLYSLQTTLRQAKTCVGDLSKGDFRFDVNVSVHDEAAKIDSHRVEIKNLNSLKDLIKAVESEHQRLIDLYESSNSFPEFSETRTWLRGLGQTKLLRFKDTNLDYRFLPEHDLPPVTFTDDEINEIRENMPETVSEIATRFRNEPYSIGPREVETLQNIYHGFDFVDQVLEKLNDVSKAKPVSNFLLNNFMALVIAKNWSLFDAVEDDFILTPEIFYQGFTLMDQKRITRTTLIEIFTEFLENRPSVEEEKNSSFVVDHVTERNLWAIDNEDQIIEELKRAYEHLRDRKGKAELFKRYKIDGILSKIENKDNNSTVALLMGQTMKQTNGQIQPGLLKEIITKYLQHLPMESR